MHKDAKTNKGHHDKENHLDKYDDHGGIDKHHHKEDKHYGSHHHEEHGKKHAKVCQVWLAAATACTIVAYFVLLPDKIFSLKSEE